MWHQLLEKMQFSSKKWKIKGVRRFSAHWGQKKYKKNSFVKSFLLHKKVYYG